MITSEIKIGWRGPSEDGILRDFYDGSVWKELIESGFFRDRRNLVFLIGADGFSKFRSRSNGGISFFFTFRSLCFLQTSFATSIVSGFYLVPMNLPPSLRMKRRYWSTICCFSEVPEDDSVLKQLLFKIVDDFSELEKG